MNFVLDGPVFSTYFAENMVCITKYSGDISTYNTSKKNSMNLDSLLTESDFSENSIHNGLPYS